MIFEVKMIHPGPVSRWYGRLGDIPILLDLHCCTALGPSVTLHHGQLAHANAVVREFFNLWGQRWEESPEQAVL